MGLKVYRAQGISNETIDLEPEFNKLLTAYDEANAPNSREIVFIPQTANIQPNERPQWTLSQSNTLNSVWGTVIPTTTVITFSQPGIWKWTVSGRGVSGTGGHQWGINQGSAVFVTNANNTTNSELFALWTQSAGYESQFSGKVIITSANTQIYLTCYAQQTSYLNVKLEALNPVSNPTNILNPTS